jgi:long-chain fatty acid transport protein
MVRATDKVGRIATNHGLAGGLAVTVKLLPSIHWKLISGLAVTLATRFATAQGIVAPGVGPVNQSMGGAATAAPIDTIGALHWNPATISDFQHSQFDLGLQLAITDAQLSSRLPAGSIAAGLPPITLLGSDDSDSGVSTLPAIGVIYKPEGRMTYGFGLYAIGGLFTNFPASTANPILTPQPPVGFGAGSVYSNLELVQMAPTLALKLNDIVSIGVAPTVTMARLQADPAQFATPDDANGDGFPSYPAATHTRPHWGAGIQGGIYVIPNENWSFGLSLKSPQWFETFKFNSSDELGSPRQLTTRADYPLILSAGAGCTDGDRLAAAVDIRFLNYANTRGFADTGFDATGAARGLGWQDVIAVASGVQYRLTSVLTVRAGYTYSQNPIPAKNAFFNIAAPAVYEHTIAAGATAHLTDSVALVLAYYHTFPNSITGQFSTPLGTIPGTAIRLQQSADSISAGVSMRY